jgi:hypothetical protein
MVQLKIATRRRPHRGEWQKRPVWEDVPWAADPHAWLGFDFDPTDFITE